MKRRGIIYQLFCFWAFTWLAAPAFGQQPDSLKPVLSLADSQSVVVRKQSGFARFFSSDYPNPRKAALFAAILPGAGQVYNKKWWKIPIAYAALGTATWIMVDNVQQYRKLRVNYELEVDGDDNTVPTEYPYNVMGATRLKFYRDQYRRYSELSYLGTGIVYLLTVTDAYVDAHLKNFDVSDDLSWRITPDFQTGAGLAYGVGIKLQF